METTSSKIIAFEGITSMLDYIRFVTKFNGLGLGNAVTYPVVPLRDPTLDGSWSWVILQMFAKAVANATNFPYDSSTYGQAASMGNPEDHALLITGMDTM
ncbi:hypothetical protein Tco_0378769 [Tanacetum coccineum]